MNAPPIDLMMRNLLDLALKPELLHMPPTLCLMLKAPRPGAVKTRLAASIGNDAAVQVYRRLVEHQAAEVPCDWRVEVHFTPAESGAEMHDWLGPLLPDQTTFHPQAEGDLGARLRATLADTITRGAREILFAGGDCPQLTTERLRDAAAALHSFSFVLIPATDGGYVLIGLSGSHAFVFDDIAWSTPAVFEQTQRNIRSHGMSVHTFARMEDVDDLPSLLRVEHYCPSLLRATACLVRNQLTASGLQPGRNQAAQTEK